MILEKNAKEIIENKTVGARRFREYAKETVVDWVPFGQLSDWMSKNFLDKI